MKHLSLFLFLYLASGCASSIQPQAAPPAPVTGSVYFPPQGEETEVIVKELDKAQKSILVQSYSFFPTPMTKALVRARERGLNVQILMVPSPLLTEEYSGTPILARAGIPIKIDSARAIAESKLIIVDGETVIMGSFNFTGEKSGEKWAVIRDKNFAVKYIEDWKRHGEDSEPYGGQRR